MNMIEQAFADTPALAPAPATTIGSRIERGIARRPRRVMLYGTHGIGKSTWASAAPSPIFLQTEDGLADIGSDRTPLLQALSEVYDWIQYLIKEEHGYATVVIDTLDWLERLIHADVARENNVENIGKIPYFRGYGFAVGKWEYLLKGLDAIRDRRKMGIILLAHADIQKVEPPDADSYNRYSPDIDKRACPMIQEWADEVLFACYKIDTIARDEGFNRERTRAIGTGDRVVYTREAPTHLAKRRAILPDRLPLDFNAYAQALVAGRGNASPASNIAGIVTNGHSKEHDNGGS